MTAEDHKAVASELAAEFGLEKTGQRAAVDAFNVAMNYNLMLPLSDFEARNAAEIAEFWGKKDVGQQIREAWEL
jgi:hypothetical protein